MPVPFWYEFNGTSLERCAENKLHLRLGKLTTNKDAGLLAVLERTSDHCSNIARCLIDAAQNNMNMHKSFREIQTEDPDYKKI